MGSIAWTEALSVAVPAIDEQHKALIERLKALAGAIARRQGEVEIMATLMFLVDYTHFHFDAEEGCMKRAGYPGLVEHQAKHRQFKEMLTTFHEDLAEEGVTKTLADSINTLLMNWLTAHISQVDREFGAFLKTRGIENCTTL